MYLLYRAIFRLRPAGKIMIIGCGRSGTTHICKVFSNLNLEIGHEKMGIHGISSWCMVPDSDIRCWGPSYYDLNDHRFTILHQVREPLGVIGSMLTAAEKSWQYIAEFIQIEENDSLLRRSMKYWYYWNLMAEKKAEYTYRIESLEDEIENLVRKTAYKFLLYKYNLTDVTRSIPKQTNSREHLKVTYRDLVMEDKELAQKILELAKKYGYHQMES